MCDYAPLNPARANLWVAEQPLQEHRWSSYALYLKEPSSRPVWLRVDRLLGAWGIPLDRAAGRQQFALRLETRRQVEVQPDFDLYKRGWCLGGEEFRQELLAQVSELASPEQRGWEIQESARAKAERILREELQSLGWSAGHRLARRKGDAQKVRIAARLRRETTMTRAWIAGQLHVGAPSHLACLLYRDKKHGSNNEGSENTDSAEKALTLLFHPS